MSTSPHQLLKLLGISFGIAVTIGGTIGAGILRKPGYIAAQLGDPWLILLVWLAVGIYAVLGVLCAIELGVAIPKAGSWYVYARRAFGNYFGFITGITSWAGTTTSLGFGAYTVAEYVNLLQPAAEPYTGAIAISLLLALAALHAKGTWVGGKSQEILSLLKALGLMLFVFVCFFGSQHLTQPQAQIINQHLERPTLMLGLIAALQAVFYTYDGWHTAAYFSEESKDPVKHLPKSMMIGVLMVISIYLLVNAAILYVLPMEVLSQSKLAAADAISMLFGPESARIVTFFLLISIIGLLNAQIMFAPRVIFSMSRDGLFFAPLQRVNALGTPAAALFLTTFISILFILMGKSVCLILADIATFFFVFSYAAGFASLIRLRRSEPDLERPFLVPFYPYLPLFLLAFSSFFLIEAAIADPRSAGFALSFLLLSIPVYWLQKHRRQV